MGDVDDDRGRAALPDRRALPEGTRVAFAAARAGLALPLVRAILGDAERLGTPDDLDDAVLGLVRHACDGSAALADAVVDSAAASVALLESLHRHRRASPADAASAMVAVVRALPPATVERLAAVGRSPDPPRDGHEGDPPPVASPPVP